MSRPRSASEPPTLRPHQRQHWARGEADCQACGGVGRIRELTYNKDGTPRNRSRWVTCACVPHANRGPVGTSAAVVLYGAPLSDPVSYPPGFVRPTTRGACEGGARPCVLVGCRYNTYLEPPAPHSGGAIRLNHGNVEPGNRPPADSCALDVAVEQHDTRLEAHGGASLERVGQVLGVVRERVRQVEEAALKKLVKKLPPDHPLRELFQDALRILMREENNDWSRW